MIYEMARLMFALMGIGVVSIVITLILIIRRKRKKSVKGEKIFCFLFGGVGSCLIIISLLWIVKERREAWWYMSADYEETGIMLNWKDPGETFVYDGKEYESFDIVCYGSDECPFTDEDAFDYSTYIDINDEKESRAVFNIEQKGDFLMHFLKRTYPKTMYETDSPLDGKIYYTDEDDLYCDKEEKQQLIQYYADSANYEYYVRKYDSNTESVERLLLSKDEEKQLKQLREQGTKVAIEISKTKDYEKDIVYEIDVISNDNLIWGRMWIVQYDGEWYWDTEEFSEDEGEENTKYVMKLPETISEKIQY